MSANVTLDWSELMLAAYAGSARRIRALRSGLSDVEGTPEIDLWGNDIESCCAELAFAKASGLYWNGPGTERKPVADVGTVQVRHTRYGDGHLLVKRADRDEDTFYLVTGSAPSFTVVGSIVARDAKREDLWRTVRGRSAWFVPQSLLKPF